MFAMDKYWSRKAMTVMITTQRLIFTTKNYKLKRKKVFDAQRQFYAKETHIHTKAAPAKLFCFPVYS